ncbi:MAG: cadherin-like domain-containing protein, partial [Pseudorhodoplanes sp.]|nr:cadherin-like domain-containing protein [Pseudorhodoplanes sp.]
MTLTITANNANGDGIGIDVTAYLADYDATFVRRGYGYFSNNSSDFSGNHYAVTEQDNLIPNPGRQSVVFESGGGGNSIDYTFATHTVGGDLNAISFGYGMSYSSGSDSFSFTQLDLRISGFGFVDQFGTGNIVSALITDGMAGEIATLNSLLASNAINFVGSTGADVFTGYSQSDTITGGNGGDTLSGAGGNDSLDGGSGDDLAVFSGARSEYVVTLLPDGRLQIVDSVAGRDGTDILSGVERGQFSNGTMALEPDPTNQPPQPAADRIFVSRGSTAEISASFFLANDSDAEGDALSITEVFGAANGTVSLLDETVTFGATASTTPATGGFSYTVSDGTSSTAASVTVDLVTTTGGNDAVTVDTLAGEASWIDGLAGQDTLTGGAGRDTLFGGAGADRLYGMGNDDLLYGGADNDTLNGGEGNDTLFGGAGVDSMSGGAGDDTYHVEDTLAVIAESDGQGFDSVFAYVSYTLSNHIEYLALFGSNLVGTGN